MIEGVHKVREAFRTPPEIFQSFYPMMDDVADKEYLIAGRNISEIAEMG